MYLPIVGDRRGPMRRGKALTGGGSLNEPTKFTLIQRHHLVNDARSSEAVDPRLRHSIYCVDSGSGVGGGADRCCELRRCNK